MTAPATNRAGGPAALIELPSPLEIRTLAPFYVEGSRGDGGEIEVLRARTHATDQPPLAAHRLVRGQSVF